MGRTIRKSGTNALQLRLQIFSRRPHLSRVPWRRARKLTTAALKVDFYLRRIRRRRTTPATNLCYKNCGESLTRIRLTVRYRSITTRWFTTDSLRKSVRLNDTKAQKESVLD